MKKVADDNTNFTLFISDIQRESFPISTSLSISSKLSGWLFMASGMSQNILNSSFTATSASDISGGWFSVSTDSSSKDHRFHHLNFREEHLCSDFRQTTDHFNYCASETKIRNIIILKNNPNIISNNYLELTYKQHCHQ